MSGGPERLQVCVVVGHERSGVEVTDDDLGTK